MLKLYESYFLMVKLADMVKKQLFFLCGLVLLGACARKNTKAQSAPLKILNQNGISIKVYDFKGIAPLLQQQNDTTYVVNFWATWCKPCIKELPYFELLGKYYEEKNVKVLLVSLDMESKIKSKLIPFIRKQRLESEVVVLDDADANSWIAKIDKGWSGAIPATLIYNKDKSAFYERSFTYKELETEVKRIL